MWLAIFYVVIIFLCNLNANAQPIMFSGWLGIYLMDFTIPLIWIIKDAIQKSGGIKLTKDIIKMNVAVNVFIYLWALIGNATAPDELYGYMTGSVLMFAFSMLAFYVAENIDAIVYDKVKGGHAKKSLCSNLVSAPIDSVIACMGLYLIGVPLHLVVISFIVQMIMKISLPAIFYMVRVGVKKDGK